MKTGKNRNAMTPCLFCEAVMRSDNIARHCERKHGEERASVAQESLKNDYRKNLRITRTIPSNVKIPCSCN